MFRSQPGATHEGIDCCLWFFVSIFVAFIIVALLAGKNATPAISRKVSAVNPWERTGQLSLTWKVIHNVVEDFLCPHPVHIYTFMSKSYLQNYILGISHHIHQQNSATCVSLDNVEHAHATTLVSLVFRS